MREVREMPLHPQRAERRRPPLTADGCWLGVTSQLRAEGSVSSRPGWGGGRGSVGSAERGGRGASRVASFFFFAAGWRGQRPTQGGRVVGGRERRSRRGSLSGGGSRVAGSLRLLRLLLAPPVPPLTPLTAVFVLWIFLHSVPSPFFLPGRRHPSVAGSLFLPLLPPAWPPPP